MTLYNIYRPQSFNGMIGNKATIESLQQQIQKENRKHIYLFTGPAGCGKTTSARIMSKALGAEKKDIHEVNCSNKTGVDDARNIIETLKYKPIGGKITVYILDEMHMTSNNFQNAFLKPFEDTPEWVYFFICTTNPEKLLSTVKSRAGVYDFKPPSTRDMIKLLQEISENEKKDISLNIIRDIIKACDNHPRKAIDTLDTVMDIAGEEAQKKAIHESFSDESAINELCIALMKGNEWTKISKLVKTLPGEAEQNRRNILNYFNSALIGGWASSYCKNSKLINIMACFEYNLFDSGKPGLSMACYRGCNV